MSCEQRGRYQSFRTLCSIDVVGILGAAERAVGRRGRYRSAERTSHVLFYLFRLKRSLRAYQNTLLNWQTSTIANISTFLVYPEQGLWKMKRELSSYLSPCSNPKKSSGPTDRFQPKTSLFVAKAALRAIIGCVPYIQLYSN
ncbi:uncharacterized protein LAJ45_04768 [Morchella importuna]|uniref:uncharacterized protein n=1 Tax=Morchella importuna TaxID=1174673 RepID=UPI001E8E1D2E|nr:uncharacterized protein LAJ45_04768 [Morchella importuna]KAH8151066.1 hypothetical protein LAJ45_04768 [Morchella importuna]